MKTFEEIYQLRESDETPSLYINRLLSDYEIDDIEEIITMVKNKFNLSWKEAEEIVVTTPNLFDLGKDGEPICDGISDVHLLFD